MQQKKTESLDLGDHDEVLKDLTEQDIAFFNLVQSGQYTQKRAFAEVFGKEHWNDNSLGVSASRLWSSPKLKLLRLLDAEALLKINARTKEERIARMERLSLVAETSGNLGAAVNAEVSAGKLEGHYIDKSEHTHIKRDETQEVMLQRILDNYGLDVMQSVAARSGIDQALVDKVAGVLH